MNRDKQIEEMAKDLSKHSFFYNGGCLMNYSLTAKLLYEAGYRKASEVAREIIADFREMIKGYENIDVYLDRIEKKYTQEE